MGEFDVAETTCLVRAKLKVLFLRRFITLGNEGIGVQASFTVSIVICFLILTTSRENGEMKLTRLCKYLAFGWLIVIDQCSSSFSSEATIEIKSENPDYFFISHIKTISLLDG